MGFDLDVTIPALTVFLQGILSFLSPCVLPIIPLYIGYLSGGGVLTKEDGTCGFSQKKVVVNTLFFIVGVSFAFFLLGLGFSAAGQFFTQHQLTFSRVGGVLIILLGLVQLGVLTHPFQGRELKLPVKINTLHMNPVTALVMGFTFSFAWTPCVGPALSTVLIMVSSASSSTLGLLLMGVYTLGFTLPFLAVGIFTTQCLNFLKQHRGVVAYTVKIGGILMILMGLMMVTGMMNGITGYLSSLDGVTATVESQQEEPEPTVAPTQEVSVEPTVEPTPEPTPEPESTVTPAFDFAMTDQYGVEHTMDDYEGKVVFLNFWATWCSPCQMELPDIQLLYESYGYNQEDVIILGVVTPRDENPYTSEGTIADVTAFLEENNYTYPTLMDTTGAFTAQHGVSAYPTTFMIDANGNIYGYVTGMLSYDIMESIVIQTQESP